MTSSDTGDGTEPPETDDPVERVAAALRGHNIEAIIAPTGDEARQVVTVDPGGPVWHRPRRPRATGRSGHEQRALAERAR